MQIVIDIPDRIYNIVQNKTLNIIDSEIVEETIRNGTPLPKGHGRLIDENYLLCILQCEEYETCTWRNCNDCNREKCIKRNDLSEVPTILDADNAESKEV